MPNPAGHAQPREPHGFLRKHLHFSESELAALDRGEVVSRTLAPADKRELVAFAAVRVQVDRAAYVDAIRDIVNFKKSPMVASIGRFGAVPDASDLAALTLDRLDLEDLRRCRVGQCKVRMTADALDRYRREAPAGPEAETALFRSILVEEARAYLRGGDAALGAYADHRLPVFRADETRAVLAQSPYLVEYLPDFHAYLAEYPNRALDDAEDFLYWSKEDTGVKPVISITHVSIHQPAGRPLTLIASKQIYASHYFTASLGLTALVDAPDGGVYLMYLNRSRTDAFKGIFAGLARIAVQRRVRDGMGETLRAVKRRLEQ